MKYEGPNSYQSKDMAHVIFLRTNKRTNEQTDGHTDGPKTICHQSIYAGGIKSGICWLLSSEFTENSQCKVIHVFCVQG